MVKSPAKAKASTKVTLSPDIANTPGLETSPKTETLVISHLQLDLKYVRFLINL